MSYCSFYKIYSVGLYKSSYTTLSGLNSSFHSIIIKVTSTVVLLRTCDNPTCTQFMLHKLELHWLYTVTFCKCQHLIEPPGFSAPLDCMEQTLTFLLIKTLNQWIMWTTNLRTCSCCSTCTDVFAHQSHRNSGSLDRSGMTESQIIDSLLKQTKEEN